jgi:hypothetical protein
MTALRRESEDRSIFLDLFSDLDFASVTCFMVNSIVLIGTSVEKGSVCLRMRPIQYAPRESPRRSP